MNTFMSHISVKNNDIVFLFCFVSKMCYDKNPHGQVDKISIDVGVVNQTKRLYRNVCKTMFSNEAQL